MGPSLAGGKYAREAPGTATEGSTTGPVRHQLTYASEKAGETPRQMGLQTRFNDNNSHGYSTTGLYGHRSTGGSRMAQLNHGTETSANQQATTSLPSKSIHASSAGHK